MIIRETSDKVTTQILFNPILHQSVGCIVPTSLGIDVDGRKVVRAGMPLMINLNNRLSNALAGSGANPMNAVLAHDLDVTDGAGNGTAIIFGFINLARVHEDLLPIITTARGNADATKLITFLTEA